MHFAQHHCHQSQCFDHILIGIAATVPGIQSNSYCEWHCDSTILYPSLKHCSTVRADCTRAEIAHGPLHCHCEVVLKNKNISFESNFNQSTCKRTVHCGHRIPCRSEELFYVYRFCRIQLIRTCQGCPAFKTCPDITWAANAWPRSLWSCTRVQKFIIIHSSHCIVGYLSRNLWNRLDFGVMFNHTVTIVTNKSRPERSQRKRNEKYCHFLELDSF